MNITRTEPPLIIAHRGYSARYPENTMAAFRAAIEAGADMIELDVTLTRDRRLVVIHDDTLERTTNGRGPVSEYSWSELQTLDAGSWFDTRFSGEGLPTLEDVLDLTGDRIGVNIEIKPGAVEPEGPPDTVDKLILDLIHDHGAASRILISSFNWEVLARIAARTDAPAIGLLSVGPVTPETIAACRNVNAFSWNANHRRLDARQVDRLHVAGFRALAYTVNTVKRFRQLVEMGIDGVFTDDPQRLRAEKGGGHTTP